MLEIANSLEEKMLSEEISSSGVRIDPVIGLNSSNSLLLESYNIHSLAVFIKEIKEIITHSNGLNGVIKLISLLIDDRILINYVYFQHMEFVNKNIQLLSMRIYFDIIKTIIHCQNEILITCAQLYRIK